jgi:hypothetical protein
MGLLVKSIIALGVKHNGTQWETKGWQVVEPIELWMGGDATPFWKGGARI